MHNNITEDLKFFNELINEFLNEERVNPVSLVIPVDELKLNKNEIITAAKDQIIQNKYLLNTDSALNNKIFWSPTFVVNSEIFWGDDRMEDAIAWSKTNE